MPTSLGMLYLANSSLYKIALTYKALPGDSRPQFATIFILSRTPDRRRVHLPCELFSERATFTVNSFTASFENICGACAKIANIHP